ncbi:hypothetical protein [Prescottella subtropica]|uniref:hypothetical protein n=1 Tax=Prescottella subtropica TaxID=2545757 RepID=UPI001386BD98|nr:hypothetical protein [Prescottella subtropica]
MTDRDPRVVAAQAVMVVSMGAMLVGHSVVWLPVAEVAVLVGTVLVLTGTPQQARRYRHCVLDLTAMALLALLMPITMTHGGAAQPIPSGASWPGHAHEAGGFGMQAAVVVVLVAWVVGHGVLWRRGGRRRTVRAAGGAVMIAASVLMSAGIG